MLVVRLYRLALALLPGAFRRQFEVEMVEVFAESVAGDTRVGRWHKLAREIADLTVTALRLRLAVPRITHAARFSAAVAAVLVAALAGSRAPLGAPVPEQLTVSDSVQFQARDPAGAFTLTIMNGRPIAATMDNVAIPDHQVVSANDSIRVLNERGHVLLAVAYYPAAVRIEWAPRSAACRGRAMQCAD
jgi:hypothetical protein